MGVRDSRITGGNGINITKEVDNNTDHATLLNNTYFRDLSDGLIKWKDLGGSISEMFSSGGDNLYTANGTLTSPRVITTSVYNPLSLFSSSPAYNRLNFRNTSNSFSRASIGLDSSENFNITTLNAYFTANILGFQITGANTTASTSLFKLTNGSGLKIMDVRAGGLMSIGDVTNPSAKLHLKGSGSTSGTIGFLVENSSNMKTLEIRDDNAIGFYGVTPTTRATTSIIAPSAVIGTGSTITEDTTFNGYTISQIVEAARNMGVLT